MTDSWDKKFVQTFSKIVGRAQNFDRILSYDETRSSRTTHKRSAGHQRKYIPLDQGKVRCVLSWLLDILIAIQISINIA